MREIPVKGNVQVYCMESSKRSYVYYVSGPETHLLVDTCLPNRGLAIWEELSGAPIHDILITHYDVDHIGSLAWLAEKSGARVWLPKKDLPYILGHKPRPGIKRIIGSLIRVPAPHNYHIIVPGDHVGPLVAVSSPGHTPGHLAYQGPGFILVGDAVATRAGKTTPAPSILAWDAEQARTTASSIVHDWHGWVLPAHGEPLLFP